jgi:hypothetical protein
MRHYFGNDTHVMILIRTNHPYLRVRRHRWYQSITGVIHHVRSYLQKGMVMIRLDAHVRTIVVLIGGKLSRIYFMQFAFCNDAPTKR